MTQLSEIEEAPRLAERAARELGDSPAAEVIRWVAATFPGRWCATSSMADAVLVHLVSQIAPGADIVFLNTGYHFPETLATRDTVATNYPVKVLSISPVRSVAAQDAVYGPQLHDRDPDLCCALRKVEPLERGLSGYDAWVTGMRRDESPTRADIPVVGWDARRGKVKVNPLATWTQADVDTYVAAHDVVLHPLLSRGYASIGCAPCTRRVAAGEDPRAGRWAGFGKTECGLHQ